MNDNKNLELMTRVLDTISEEPNSVHKICCKSKLYFRVVQNQLKLIEFAQSHKKLVFERIGLRIFVRFEK